MLASAAGIWFSSPRHPRVSVAAGGLNLLGRELFDAAGRVTNNKAPIVQRPAFVIPCILAAVDRTLAFHPYTSALQAAITCEISDVGLASRPLPSPALLISDVRLRPASNRPNSLCVDFTRTRPESRITPPSLRCRGSGLSTHFVGTLPGFTGDSARKPAQARQFGISSLRKFSRGIYQDILILRV
jgi:hypothetical protein